MIRHLVKYNQEIGKNKIFYIIFLFILLSCNSTPVFVENTYNLDLSFENIIEYKIDGAFKKAEFILEGYSDGKGMLLLFCPPYPDDRENYKDGIIITGNIDYKFEQTWYMNEVMVKYIPYEPSTGKLSIKFRVF